MRCDIQFRRLGIRVRRRPQVFLFGVSKQYSFRQWLASIGVVPRVLHPFCPRHSWDWLNESAHRVARRDSKLAAVGDGTMRVSSTGAEIDNCDGRWYCGTASRDGLLVTVHGRLA